jgi:hypothetical protein
MTGHEDMARLAPGLGISFYESSSNSKSKRHLRWLVFLLLNVLPVRLRRLDPRRLDVIFDLKPE